MPRLLQSLLNQDYQRMRDTRIFLADAGSTDNTPGIARDFSDRLAVTVIDGGLPSVGRNNGARCAGSSYLLFIDADIELADTSLIRRAVDLMRERSLHCVTTDIFCRDGGWKDRFLYACSNLTQRLSRFHKPFATGMFMLFDRKRFDEIGGFDELALYAEDYQLTRQVDRRRFSIVRGGVYTTNRRFRKMGHWTIAAQFIRTALHGGRMAYFRKRTHRTYWDSY
ncbi:MAG TPA: glycosyltransferase [Acidobacteriota bacterium]|nr:glycosyltransferase [Acidobacteriota bacterium]